MEKLNLDYIAAKRKDEHGVYKFNADSKILPAVLGSVNKAVFLESLHKLIQGNRKLHSKDVWIEKTYEEWHVNLPFFSVRTIKRIVNDLRNRGIVVTKNRRGMDRTLLYRIDYEKLNDSIMKFRENKNMWEPSTKVKKSEEDVPHACNCPRNGRNP